MGPEPGAPTMVGSPTLQRGKDSESRGAELERALLRCPRGRLACEKGQVHVEARPSPQLALDRYAAIMLSDYPVHDREAKTGALPDGFCREERIENVLHGRLIHPASGIAD